MYLLYNAKSYYNTQSKRFTNIGEGCGQVVTTQCSVLTYIVAHTPMLLLSLFHLFTLPSLSLESEKSDGKQNEDKVMAK
jgi:hypothetical protein